MCGQFIPVPTQITVCKVKDREGGGLSPREARCGLHAVVPHAVGLHAERQQRALMCVYFIALC